MASSDSENKPNHTEAAQPEQKSKAKPRSRKAKAKPKKTAESEEKPGLKNAETQEKSSGQEAETQPNEASKPAAEKAAKKKAKSRGRKSKAKPKADEALQAEGVNPDISEPGAAPSAAPEPATPLAEKTDHPQPAIADQTEKGNQEELRNTGAGEPVQAESSPAAVEGKKKPKGKRRGRPKKNRSAKEASKSETAQAMTPQPVTPQELAAEETIAEYETAEPDVPESIAAEPVAPKPVPPVPKRQPPLVIIASGNPAKIKAVELAFSRMFPDEKFDYEGISVESGVSDQPMSDDETFAGALMRAQTCRESRPEATYWVGLEGGLEDIGDELHAFAWMVIFGPDELMGKSRTATFVLPPAVAELILVEGKELGEADDLVFGKTNSKQSSGAVGILTHGLIDRANYYAEALTLALVPFKNPHLYKVEQPEAVEAEA